MLIPLLHRSVIDPTETVGFVVEDCSNATGENASTAECPGKGNTMDDTAILSCDDDAKETAENDPGISGEEGVVEEVKVRIEQSKIT